MTLSNDEVDLQVAANFMRSTADELRNRLSSIESSIHRLQREEALAGLRTQINTLVADLAEVRGRLTQQEVRLDSLFSAAEEEGLDPQGSEGE